jgi:tetratricopeptide (TPR) repeat protein
VSSTLGPEVEAAFAAAVELSQAEQEAFLDREYADNPELRKEVVSLLRAYRAAGAFLESGIYSAGALTVSARTPPTVAPTIGRYRILRLLGEGGMGVVYEAEQEQPRRTVALKLIKAAFAGPELLRRFEQEWQALGRLQHPGIAQIYEAGTADGVFGPNPYFAMELIHGASLVEYTDAHHLTMRQRLELMSRVCEAVHHAHQRGVIHRDLKPGNILVDESGQPKILDFGIARATSPDAQPLEHTDSGQLLGTLAYMSPELVLADPLEVDARSDVYALGVILFELLSGRLPYRINSQRHEAVRTIREEDATRLSLVSRTYRGDVETIVSKALEKDKARRYSSAAELGSDIRRYLSDEPIVARGPSATYLLRKFVRRHKALVGGVSGVFAVLIAGIVASTWEAARARRAEQTAEAISNFLRNDLLAQASATVQARPDSKPDPDLKVRTALDRAAKRITGKFEMQPLVESAIRETVASAYKELGLYPDAQPQLERALELRRRALGNDHTVTLSTMHALAELYRLQGKYARAEPLFNKVLELQRHLLGGEHRDTLSTMNDLALLYLYQGKYAQAEPLFTEVLQGRRSLQGEEHPETLTSMNDLAVLYRRQARYPEAEVLLTRVMEGRRRVQGEDHPDTLTSMNNLAVVYRHRGKYAQAELLLTRVVQGRRRVQGQDHLETLASMNNLAQVYRDQGRYTVAEPLFTKVLEVQRRLQGEEHPSTLVIMNNLAVLYGCQGKYAQAEPLFTKVLDLQRRVLGQEHPDTQNSVYNLALMYLAEGRDTQAEPLFTQGLEIRRRILGPADPDTTNVLASLGEVRLHQQRYAEAEALLSEAWKAQTKTTPEAWQQFVTQSMLGASLAAQGRFTEAEPLLMAGYDGLMARKEAIAWESRCQLERACARIVQLLQQWGRTKSAAEWQLKLQRLRP